MAENKIQKQFGERVVASLGAYAVQHAEAFGHDIIQEFSSFARQDIGSVGELEQSNFSHVDDPALRTALAQVLYGARWLYKLGLALLVEGGTEERAAHVRAQIVDYASVVEALLSYCNGRAIDGGHTHGGDYRWKDPDRRTQQIHWNPPLASEQAIIRKLPLWWHARVAKEFGIIDRVLNEAIDGLREERNTVHVRERVAVGATAYLKQSKTAFETLLQSIHQTKLWCAQHPRAFTPATKRSHSTAVPPIVSRRQLKPAR